MFAQVLATIIMLVYFAMAILCVIKPEQALKSQFGRVCKIFCVNSQTYFKMKERLV